MTSAHHDGGLAAEFGSFGGTQPSELFLKVFAHVEEALRRNPEGNVVAKKYTGTTGTVPLTILSNMPDIILHCCQLIVAARHEVLLATNAWKNSESVKSLGEALRELSRRTVAQGYGKKVTVRIMFLMLSPKLLLHTHVPIPDPKVSSEKVGLPEPSELPGIHLQVVNYHNLPLGTLHSKFLVIDRKLAVVGSNNIQDNANLEMSCDFQGPIVEGIRQVFLESWDPREEDTALDQSGLTLETSNDEWPSSGNWAAYISEISCRWEQKENESRMAAITRCLNSTYSPETVGNATEEDIADRMFTPCMKTLSQEIPIALVNRHYRAIPVHALTSTSKKPSVPQNEAWLAAVKYAGRSLFIQTPDFNAKPIVEEVLNAARRRVEVTIFVTSGYNDAGEMLTGGHNDKVIEKMYKGLAPEFKQYLKMYWYVGRDMRKPLHATARCRNSHVKLMIVDNQVGIMGSGNQDSQSWYNSQEINLMVDSRFVCQTWMEMIDHNQNTRIYGLIDPEDGIWKDQNNNAATIEGAYGPGAGVKGFIKAAYLAATGKAK